MFCKVCNTRLDEGSRACPNCGAHNATGGRPAPRADAPQALGPSSAGDDDLDIELDEVLEEAGVEKPSAAREPKPARRGQETQPIVPIDLDPVGLRKQLAEHPALLEPGLTVFCHEQGSPVGAGFATAVGPIDLLARDARGGLVVVMVADRDQGSEIVAEMLQRIGWVRKHLAERGEAPRGVVLFERPPENLGYAAAAVTDTIAFKTYRVSVSFDDVSF